MAKNNKKLQEELVEKIKEFVPYYVKEGIDEELKTKIITEYSQKAHKPAIF